MLPTSTEMMTQCTLKSGSETWVLNPCTINSLRILGQNMWLSWVQWQQPIFPATWDAEARGNLEHRSSIPAWETQQEPCLNKKSTRLLSVSSLRRDYKQNICPVVREKKILEMVKHMYTEIVTVKCLEIEKHRITVSLLAFPKHQGVIVLPLHLSPNQGSQGSTSSIPRLTRRLVVTKQLSLLIQHVVVI